ncbi:MAG: ACT domain-containing protein [Candidatus Micrarchaeota archaeon]|nr:ACT domain-containing protein [Candidatus Micrarchaeota archaeon]
MEKVSELVWLYVKRRPFLRETLREKLVNYSALARKISLTVLRDKRKTSAVKMALVRIVEKMKKSDTDLEASIFNILSQSTISIRNKVAVVISRSQLSDVEYLSYAESKNLFTYVVEEAELESVKKTKSVLRVVDNLNLIAIHSPVELEETPGVIAYLLGALASEGINVVEAISCYTDTLLLVRQPDTIQAYEILSKLTSR